MIKKASTSHPALLVAAALLLTTGLMLSLSSCGYRLGGLRAVGMENMNTFTVRMFENNTTEPMAAMLFTTALADNLQRDGVYQIASRHAADFYITGCVRRTSLSSLRTDPDDTYVSSEVGITIDVEYKVVNAKTGGIITENSTEGTGSYFTSMGNVQQARDNALSYAARQAAENIVNNLTTR